MFTDMSACKFQNANSYINLWRTHLYYFSLTKQYLWVYFTIQYDNG